MDIDHPSIIEALRENERQHELVEERPKPQDIRVQEAQADQRRKFQKAMRTDRRPRN